MLVIRNNSSLPDAGVAYEIGKEHHLARPDKGQLEGPAIEISGDHDEELESDRRWLCQSNKGKSNRTNYSWIEKKDLRRERGVIVLSDVTQKFAWQMARLSINPSCA